MMPIRRAKCCLSIGMVAGVTATLFVGVGVSSASEVYASKPVASQTENSITIQVESGDSAEENCYINVFKQQNPGVSVTTSIVSPLAEEGANLTVLTSSNPPDVGAIATNTAVFARMLAANDLSPITSVWKADNLDTAYGANTAKLYKSKGVPYVVPQDDSFYNILFYNASLFKKLGIPQPINHRISSFGQFLTMAKDLQKAGNDGVAMAGASGYEASWMIDTYLNTLATPAQYANYLTSWQPGVSLTAPYTAGPFLKALDAIQDMSKANVFAPGSLGLTQGAESEALFTSGTAGMLLDGDWIVGSVLEGKSGAKFSWGWSLFPPAPGATRANEISLYSGGTLGIPAGAKNKALAAKYLQVVGSPKGQLCDVKAGNIPATVTLPSQDLTSLPAVVRQMLQFAKQNGDQTGWTSGLAGNVGATFTDPLVQELLSGSVTPAQVAGKVYANLLKAKSGKS